MRGGCWSAAAASGLGLFAAWALAVTFVVGAADCARSPRAAGDARLGDRSVQADTANSPPAAAGDRGPPVPRLQPGTVADVVDPAHLERLVARNLAPETSLPETLLADRIARWGGLPVGARIARWGELFATRSDNVYCFGPRAGGYVADSLLVQDHKFDCVLLFYRATELARATSPRDAILIALGTRFAGGDPERVLCATGAVIYDDPSHLDYSEDFAATGLWGRDVTRAVGAAVPDSVGTRRYAAGRRDFIPTARLRLDRLRDGDLLFFVLDEHHPAGLELRRQYGLLVGHQGIVHVAGGTVYLLHAAASDLQGIYAGNRVVRVPLLAYLRRVERFKGVMVSRIEADTPPGTRR